MTEHPPAQPTVAPGQLWRDVDGHARVCGVVPVERGDYAVMLRTRGSGGRKRRPFLFPIASLLRGDDGWRLVDDPECAQRKAAESGRP